MSNIPTEKLFISDPANANEEILAFAKTLSDRGERAWFEVHYPKPDDMSQEEFDAKNAETYDALEVIDGEIHTLPPYSALEKEAEA